MKTRLLNSEEMHEALGDMPIRQRAEPVIRIRHVFLAAFCVALFSTLTIMEPLTIMIEVAR